MGSSRDILDDFVTHLADTSLPVLRKVVNMTDASVRHPYYLLHKPTQKLVFYEAMHKSSTITVYHVKCRNCKDC